MLCWRSTETQIHNRKLVVSQAKWSLFPSFSPFVVSFSIAPFQTNKLYSSRLIMVRQFIIYLQQQSNHRKRNRREKKTTELFLRTLLWSENNTNVSKQIKRHWYTRNSLRLISGHQSNRDRGDRKTIAHKKNYAPCFPLCAMWVCVCGCVCQFVAHLFWCKCCQVKRHTLHEPNYGWHEPNSEKLIALVRNVYSYFKYFSVITSMLSISNCLSCISYKLQVLWNP